MYGRCAPFPRESFRLGTGVGKGGVKGDHSTPGSRITPDACSDAAGGVPAAGGSAGTESARVTEDCEQSQPLGAIPRAIFETAFASFSRQRHRDRFQERGLAQWFRVDRREYDWGAGTGL